MITRTQVFDRAERLKLLLDAEAESLSELAYPFYSKSSGSEHSHSRYAIENMLRAMSASPMEDI